MNNNNINAKDLQMGDRVNIGDKPWICTGICPSTDFPGQIFAAFGWNGEIWGRSYDPDHQFEVVSKESVR